MMIFDFTKRKAKHDEAKSKAKRLNDYVLEKCYHNEAMTSFIEDPAFQKELVKTLTTTQKTDD